MLHYILLQNFSKYDHCKIVQINIYMDQVFQTAFYCLFYCMKVSFFVKVWQNVRTWIILIPSWMDRNSWIIFFHRLFEYMWDYKHYQLVLKQIDVIMILQLQSLCHFNALEVLWNSTEFILVWRNILTVVL
jgi:hypothetical protein